MYRLKLSEWLLVGSVALTAASACGGRSILLPGEISDDVAEVAGMSGSASHFGGTTTGGQPPTAGGRAAAGFASGGTAAAGGAPGLGGSGMAGASSIVVCPPKTEECRDNVIFTCDSTGQNLSTTACGADAACVEQGGRATCQTLACKPLSRQCSDSGEVLVCDEQGSSLDTEASCADRGQRCYFGECRSMVCPPGQAFCDGSGLRLCDSTGTLSELIQACEPGQYCNSSSLECTSGVCFAGEPTCNGSIATVCSADGKGYVEEGSDCSSAPGEQCVAGSCACRPGRADCNGNAADGCETDVSKDVDNCGTCKAVCSHAHLMDVTCDDGCRGECEADFGDCNDDKLHDGCETNLRSDHDNCGECGKACEFGEGCHSGRCIFTL